MNAGIIYGYAGLVDGLVEAINAERGVQVQGGGHRRPGQDYCPSIPHHPGRG
jgi:pantothenate kinase type III